MARMISGMIGYYKNLNLKVRLFSFVKRLLLCLNVVNGGNVMTLCLKPGKKILYRKYLFQYPTSLSKASPKLTNMPVFKAYQDLNIYMSKTSLKQTNL